MIILCMYAERVAWLSLNEFKIIYTLTMCMFDEQREKKIKKHSVERQLRALPK